jgi:hypothetical protein
MTYFEKSCIRSTPAGTRFQRCEARGGGLNGFTYPFENWSQPTHPPPHFFGPVSLPFLVRTEKVLENLQILLKNILYLKSTLMADKLGRLSV